MTICDMCGKNFNPYDVIVCKFENFAFVEKEYLLCPECRVKIEKFIAFQSFRNTKEDVNK